MKEFLKEASGFIPAFSVLFILLLFFKMMNKSVQIEDIFNLKKLLDCINIVAVLICGPVHCSCWLMQ